MVRFSVLKSMPLSMPRWAPRLPFGRNRTRVVPLGENFDAIVPAAGKKSDVDAALSSAFGSQASTESPGSEPYPSLPSSSEDEETGDGNARSADPGDDGKPDPQAPDGLDDNLSIGESLISGTSQDSLTVSEPSEDEDEERTTPRLLPRKGPTASRRPPRMPGRVLFQPIKNRYNGKWSLCSPKGQTCDWLDSLTIRGPAVIDGVGKLCWLKPGEDGRPMLDGGTLKIKGAALVRVGKSGRVQVYLRSE